MKVLKRMTSALIAVTLLLGMVGCTSGGGDGTEPVFTIQPAGDGGATEPTGNVTEPDEGVTDPAGDATEPDVTVPDATDPAGPGAENPSEPDVIGPTEVAPSEPEVTEPVATDPPTTEPAPTEPPATQHVHKYTSKVVKPTCEKKGYTIYTCVCGESYKDDYTEKIDHVYDGYVCVECGEKKEGPINGMDIVREALQYLGLNYVLGGNSLTEGTDCSGFTSLIYKKFGISLPRTALDQSKAGESLAWEDAKPGDLYAVEYKDNPNWNGHAGIYIGNGWLLSAWPDSGVRVTKIGEGDVIRKVFENSYTGTDEDAFREVHARLFELEMYGEQYRMRYYFDTGEIVMEAESPISTEIWNNISLEVSSANIPEGYEPAMEAWKKQFEERAYKRFTIHAYGETWCFWKGQWYTDDQMWEMRDAGLLEFDEGRSADKFSGVPWDPQSTIVTHEGEIVDFSTFPTDYIPPEQTE